MERRIKSYRLYALENKELPNHPLIESVGHETWTKNDAEKYDWDCRKINESICIFQYTVSGYGMLEINGKPARQTAGCAFMIERPGNYRYWLPEDSEYWEFKFISLTMASLPYWNNITNQYGKTFTVPSDCEALKLIDSILDILSKSKIETIFDNSILAYQFIMTLHKYLSEHGTTSTYDESIRHGIEYLNSEYAKSISLADIANVTGISPFYVNRYFKKFTGESPIEYLNKIRIRQSLKFLSDTNMRIDAVARQCGFSGANYYAKVFRKLLGRTPTEYREAYTSGKNR